MTYPEPAAPESAGQIDLRSIIGVLRRQSRVVFYAAALVAAVTALYLSLATPRYQAEALLMIDPSGVDILDARQTAATSNATESARIDSEVEVLRSDALALKVIAAMALANDPEFSSPPRLSERLARLAGRAYAAPTAGQPAATADTIARFENAVAVRRRGLTYIVSVAARSRDPRRAAELANVLARSYIEAQVAGKVAASLAARDVIEAQLASARQRLDRFEAEFDRTLQDSIISAAELLDGPQRAMVGDLVRTRDRSAVARQAIEAAKRGLEGRDFADFAALWDDGLVGKLVEERAALSGRPGSDDAIRAIDARLSRRAEAAMDRLSADVADLDGRAAELRDELRRAVPVDKLPADRVDALVALRQEAEIARSQRDTLLTRMRGLESQAGAQLANARLVSAAVIPVRAAFPDTGLVGLLALAVATGLGLGLAFLSEYFVGGVTSERQLDEVLALPAVAEIPQTRDVNSGRMSGADRVIDAPLSPYSESFRKLRAALDQPLRHAAPGRGAVVMLTSALAGEGKTTAALALARTYALSGRKTLLIDADLRSPSLHRQLGFEPAHGLAEYLHDPDATRGIHDFYARDPVSPLALILGARPSQIATDQLLNGESFLRILRQAREVYDVTIIDTPPILPVVDARYVAAHVDAAVLAVKWAATRQSDLRAAAAQLSAGLAGDAFAVSVLTQSRSGRAASPGYAQYYSPYSAAI